MTPDEMTRQLIATGRSLIAVIDEESTALIATRISRVAELREQKESTAAAYETIIKQLGETPDIFQRASPATRRELNAIKDALNAATIRNVNALRAALELNRRLVQTIADSVNRQRITAAGYTKTGGNYAQPLSPIAGEVVPVSLNETF